MWDNAEVAGLLDGAGRVCVISRNEDEAPVRDVLGKRVVDIVRAESRDDFEAAFRQAADGCEVFVLLSALADAGHVVWARVRMMPSPVAASPVLFHFRRLPRDWDRLSPRERDVVHALHDAAMNPKRAAAKLQMSVHTLNAHRRSICQKCGLQSVGEFWVFVEQCR
jgi:DNA-binding CsgD family transcriptional regulator